MVKIRFGKNLYNSILTRGLRFEIAQPPRRLRFFAIMRPS
ncbi:hypothetical protein HMPREF9123_2836 [Neisseria bacilliformis ATCC BAA-1200]|uniref:Uncharacterized protein n=1 Tax=Neisseria bacilliformis ATCC BAA-1200 TaxID=888742 RepID=F2BGH9_9NEIS|nr:hypothetical protein HMPREF9123_2836 [Neisseria bacilliformis ATCC BAA-1200]